MKYSEYPYERINLDKAKDKMSGWLSRFNDALSADDQISVLKEVDESSREYSSYQAIASLNFNKNINDKINIDNFNFNYNDLNCRIITVNTCIHIYIYYYLFFNPK